MLAFYFNAIVHPNYFDVIVFLVVSKCTVNLIRILCKSFNTNVCTKLTSVETTVGSVLSKNEVWVHTCQSKNSAINVWSVMYGVLVALWLGCNSFKF